MPGKITELGTLTGATAATTDLIETVDVSDTSMATTGTNKRMPFSELVAFLNANGVGAVRGLILADEDWNNYTEPGTWQTQSAVISTVDQHTPAWAESQNGTLVVYQGALDDADPENYIYKVVTQVWYSGQMPTSRYYIADLVGQWDQWTPWTQAYAPKEAYIGPDDDWDTFSGAGTYSTERATDPVAQHAPPLAATQYGTLVIEALWNIGSEVHTWTALTDGNPATPVQWIRRADPMTGTMADCAWVPVGGLTQTQADARYLNVSGDTMGGGLDMSYHQITSLSAGVNPADAVTKSQLDAVGQPTSVAAKTLRGNPSLGIGPITDLTVAQTKTMLA
jgi:hypothetical protein